MTLIEKYQVKKEDDEDSFIRRTFNSHYGYRIW
jgi:hypothetical protein